MPSQRELAVPIGITAATLVVHLLLLAALYMVLAVFFSAAAALGSNLELAAPWHARWNSRLAGLVMDRIQGRPSGLITVFAVADMFVMLVLAAVRKNWKWHWAVGITVVLFLLLLFAAASTLQYQHEIVVHFARDINI